MSASLKPLSFSTPVPRKAKSLPKPRDGSALVLETTRKISLSNSPREGLLSVVIKDHNESGVFSALRSKKIFMLISTTFSRQMYTSETILKSTKQIPEQKFSFFTNDLDGMLVISLYSSKRAKSKKIGEASIDLLELSEDYCDDMWLDVMFNDATLGKTKTDISFGLKVSISHKPIDDYSDEGEEPKGFHDYYSLGKLIGTGAFSKVFKALHKSTGIVYAVKRIPLANQTPQKLKSINEEIEIMKELKSDYIVQLHETFQDYDYLYIVLEYAKHGELFEYVTTQNLGFLSEKVARNTVRQIIQGIAYMHKNGIVHRDIKLENILITKKHARNIEIKITDFGLSKSFSTYSLQTPCGTPEYAAPEVISGDFYDNSIDLWSVGVVTYMLLSGTAPFFGDRNEIFKKIRYAQYDFSGPHWRYVSEEAREFITSLLKLDPASRPTAEQCLLSPWLSKENDDEIPLRSSR